MPEQQNTMTPEEAKTVIVDNIVADAIDVAEAYWEDYPLIGEHDWDGIVQAVTDRGATVRPTPERFREAYRLLSEGVSRD